MPKGGRGGASAVQFHWRALLACTCLWLCQLRWGMCVLNIIQHGLEFEISSEGKFARICRDDIMIVGATVGFEPWNVLEHFIQDRSDVLQSDWYPTSSYDTNPFAASDIWTATFYCDSLALDDRVNHHKSHPRPKLLVLLIFMTGPPQSRNLLSIVIKGTPLIWCQFYWSIGVRNMILFGGFLNEIQCEWPFEAKQKYRPITVTVYVVCDSFLQWLCPR